MRIECTTHNSLGNAPEHARRRANAKQMRSDCHHAICSHVLAVSHLEGADLKRELEPLAPRREPHRPKAARGALQRQPADGRMPALIEHGEGAEQDVEEM